MAEINKRVVDILGNVYELEKELGRGGQGAVFAVKNGQQAVKILFNRSPIKRTQLRQQIKQVQMLFDINKLAIAQPLEMLKEPNLGYVMELLTDMIPISKLIDIPKNTECLVTWYLQGGGLRRRLLLLARCAETLSQLHGKGLVYSDPSPNNIFISADVNNSEIIRLIDADNLHYQSNVNSINCYTPEFGAPELITGKSGVNTLTDAHAFAVIAFKALSLTHPLIGDMVIDGEPELETQALAGKLPWIDDPEDKSNYTENRFPRDIVLSPNLKKLAQKSFGIGLKEPKKRPGIGEWTEKLYQSADITIQCPKCQSTYYANYKNCPWCNHPRPSYVLMRIHKWDAIERKIIKDNTLQFIALTALEPVIITNRISKGRIGIDADHSNLEVILEGTRIKIRSLNKECFWLTSTRTQQKQEVEDRWRIFPPVIAKTDELWILHFGNLDHIHRCATFQIIPGAKL
jgi:DNA-binding helix-hairpin-helix protein with protein kinase domain